MRRIPCSFARPDALAPAIFEVIPEAFCDANFHPPWEGQSLEKRDLKLIWKKSYIDTSRHERLA